MHLLLHSIHRVLISVSDKSNIIEFANILSNKYKSQLIATKGTANILINNGLQVTEISDYINFPETINNRIKTLHPKIYGGILAQHDNDKLIMKKYDIKPIDMVIVNFYPFQNIIKQNKQQTKKEIKEIIENIDIGGPTLARSAAKNYNDVAVITDNEDIKPIIKEMNQYNGSLTIQTRLNLAIKAFQYVTQYDSIISNYFNERLQTNNKIKTQLFPQNISFMKNHFTKQQNMRYGENEHQRAVLYKKTNHPDTTTICNTKQIQGKYLSYNNIIDTDTALECVKMFSKPTCVIVKHTNPCGVASATNILSAYELAYKSDPISAFGGIIAFNKRINSKTAKTIINNKQFIEVIIAPNIDNDALKILSYKKNTRILICNDWKKNNKSQTLHFKNINGGLLLQEKNIFDINIKQIKIVTNRQPTKKEIKDAYFCWKIVKFVKSNAIVCGLNNQTIGIGAGQTSRIFAIKIAKIKAINSGLQTEKAVMASDAFIPFCDGIEEAASMGIKCIIQPGGSIRDEEIIKTANKYNIAMIFTYLRHLRH